ncbi:hypothetical protein BB561_005137 [Smittium simulii]|uniref:Bile salt export pump n=1 Tax=Smittium simulii TaxID=133385 RepID=A0A2T9YC28_9FUNG|nr:hypothetical protein BB561_005137 [Smittium simulii]
MSKDSISDKSSKENGTLIENNNQKKSEKNEELPQKKRFFNRESKFATKIELVMLFFGFIAAIISGLLLPANFFFFSDLTGAFISYVARIEIEPREVANDYLNDQVNKYCLIFVGFAGAMFISSYLQSSFFSIVSEKQTLRIRETYYKSALRQNMGWFDEYSTGDLTTRISSDVSIIQDGIGVKLSYCVQYLSTFLGGFILAFIRGYKMALVLIGALPFLAIVGVLMGINVGKYSKLIQDQYSKSGEVANEVFSSIRTVMAFNGQSRELKRYSKSNHIASKFEKKKSLVLGLGLGGIFFFIYAIYSLGFWYGAKLVRQGTYEPAQVLNVFFAVIIGGFSLGGAAPSISAVISAKSAAYSVFKVIDRVSPIDPLDTHNGIQIEKLIGEIELRNVTFRYPTRPELPALKNFSIKIKAGERVALVGESGCGKSTIIALIQRLYDPEEGMVLIDGIDVKEFNVSSLRRNLSLVSQEPVLFDTSIYQNIAWGSKDYDNNQPSLEEVTEMCKAANINNFITSLPSQYETNVGERGTQLSGGQKQRIAIARALLRKSKILLLDEATSALDTESERLVQEAIDKNITEQTTITIAHRLSTIKNSDMIYVCSKGNIIEQGTHQQLIERNGAYFALVNAQELQNVKNVDINNNKKSKLQSGVEINKIDKMGNMTKTEKRNSEQSSNDTLKLKKKVKISNYGNLFRLYKMYRKEVKLYGIGVIGSIMDGLIFPLFSIFFSKILVAFAIIDPVKQEKETNKYALLFLILAILIFIAVVIRTLFFGIGSSKMAEKVRNDLFSKTIDQELSYFDSKDNGTGAVTTRLSTEPESIYKFGSDALPLIISAFVSLITGVIIAFTRGWKLTLIVLATLPVLVFSEGQKSRVLTGRAKKNQKVIEAGAKEAAETISNIRTVASLNRENTFINSFNNNNKKPSKEAIKSAYIGAITYGFAQSFVFLIYSLTFYAGAQFVINESLTVEAMFNTFYAILFAAIALGQASQFLGFVPKAVTSAIVINREFGIKPLINIREESGLCPLDKNGYVFTEDVDFTYPTRQATQILKSISIKAKPGQNIALVGSSGSGKSTIINLIMRLYDVQSGTVSVEKTCVKDWNLRQLREHLSLVSQEPVLFDYSISENIRYGNPQATDFEVEKAAKDANIHNVLIGLPDGYHTRVGSSGSLLSGGQKQRVAIARAIISNPKILLLDEATSALDTESEVVVQKALESASNGRTTITIAHRLSTIQNADYIYVLDSGKVAEHGTHQTLTKRKGIYYSLAVQQSLS